MAGNLFLSYDDDPSKGITLSPSGTSNENINLKLPLTDGLLLNDQSPSIAGHVHLTAFGKGNTDRMLTVQSNNGELYLYPDGSSSMHFAGVACYFDNTVYFGNGFAFPTYASSLQGNGTNLTGFAQGWFNAAAVGTVQTGTDWNAGQARDNCNFVVKNRRQDVGNPADQFSFSTWNEIPDSAPVEYELKAYITGDGHFYDNGNKLATEQYVQQLEARIASLEAALRTTTHTVVVKQLDQGKVGFNSGDEDCNPSTLFGVYQFGIECGNGSTTINTLFDSYVPSTVYIGRQDTGTVYHTTVASTRVPANNYDIVFDGVELFTEDDVGKTIKLYIGEQPPQWP